MQVVKNGEGSTVFAISVGGYNRISLLTNSFPDVGRLLVRNADGTINDPEHPAAVGETVTLFGTGVGYPVKDGATVNLSLNPFVGIAKFPPPPTLILGTVRQMPGFILNLAAIDFVVPKGGAPQGDFVISSGSFSGSVFYH